jgi:hypothetical protein
MTAISTTASTAVKGSRRWWVLASLTGALLMSLANLTTRNELSAGADAVSATIAGYSRAGLVGALLLFGAAVLVWLVPGLPGGRDTGSRRAGGRTRPRRSGRRAGSSPR